MDQSNTKPLFLSRWVPASSNKRMISASPFWAANIRGVRPSDPRCMFTSAPFPKNRKARRQQTQSHMSVNRYPCIKEEVFDSPTRTRAHDNRRSSIEYSVKQLHLLVLMRERIGLNRGNIEFHTRYEKKQKLQLQCSVEKKLFLCSTDLQLLTNE